MREQGEQGKMRGTKRITNAHAPCPMPNDYFVFLILFNCYAQIFKAFANLYYLS